MAKYIINLKNFNLDVTLLRDIFNFEDNICHGLNKKKYCDLVCNEFFKQFDKTVNIKWGRDTGKSIIIELYCASKTCKSQFKLTQKKNQIKSDESAVMQVKTTEALCTHEDEKLIRQLRGDERKEIALKIKGTSVDVVRTDAILTSNKKSLTQGNMQKIYTKNVLRKANISQKIFTARIQTD